MIKNVGCENGGDRTLNYVIHENHPVYYTYTIISLMPVTSALDTYVREFPTIKRPYTHYDINYCVVKNNIA